MSLGLRLLARLSDQLLTPDALLSSTADWLRHRYREMRPKCRIGEVDSFLTLFCQLHPAAEDLELSLVGAGQLVASANTTTVGPGYHVFVSTLLKELAQEIGASWQKPVTDSGEFEDETGYFFTNDEEHLKAEMSRWLAALANVVRDETIDRQSWPMALCLPIDTQFEAESPAITPLGPRDREWLARTRRNGDDGTDFFAWWESGFTAEYYLRRALTQMWANVRWRPSINDSERLALEDVAC